MSALYIERLQLSGGHQERRSVAPWLHYLLGGGLLTDKDTVPSHLIISVTVQIATSSINARAIKSGALQLSYLLQYKSQYI